MSRLIDTDAHREAFMEMVYEELADDPDNNRANRIIDFFDSMPVSYDVDKVVEQIRSKHCGKCRNYIAKGWLDRDYCRREKCDIHDICELVKAGGVK